MTKVKVSAVVITFNEERNIGRCLQSLEKVVDEIIVVDSFSSDRTIELLSAFPKVKINQVDWKGFSDTKNHANELASGDYILSIDADEELSSELQQSITEALQSIKPGEVYRINRLTNYCGQWIRHSGWYPEYKVRLFPRATSQWRGTLHEELVFQHPVKIKTLEGDLLHYSYPTVDAHLTKMLSYATLAVKKDLAAGKRYSFINHGLIKPVFVFIRKYFLQAGFLDGFYGFVIAINSAYERFLRYARYRKLKP